MSTRRGLFVHLSAGVLLLAGTVAAQDSPSLGDLARQQRQQRVQSKSVSAKPSNPGAKIITNEELSKGAGSESPTAAKAGESATPSASPDTKQSPEDLKSEILLQKLKSPHCKRRSMRSTSPSSLLPRTASATVPNGTSGKRKSSNRWSGQGPYWKN